MTQAAPATEAQAAAWPRDLSLDFADTDIREVVQQILGNILHVNYTIDPNVRGTATFRTQQPLSRAQLIPVLEVLLGENGAVLQHSGELYQVLPAGPNGSAVGSTIIPLHFVSAADLVRVLQPFAGNNARMAAATGRNAVVIGGDLTQQRAMADLVRAFDINILADQSFALLPVQDGTAKDFASALQDAFRTSNNGALVDVVRIVPMDRVNAVLVVASQPGYVAQVRRVFALVEANRRRTVRSWHVYYLQNSHADDTAYVLQQAFTPNNVTAQPTAPANTNNGMQSINGFAGNQASGGAAGGAAGATGGLLGQQAGPALQTGSSPAVPATGEAGAGASTSGQITVGGRGALAATSNPLLGGLDQSAQGGNPDTMRIIPDPQNNALLIYGTPQENDTVTAMLHKIDVLPLQVRIDATIAEVTLNDELKYGTQFFFKAGGINGILSNATQSLQNADLSAAQFGTSFPGFVVGGGALGGAPLAISALQAVTTVRVLSSPQVVVLDNQPAKLQVGDLVPYLTGSANVLNNATTVVNSVNYRETGVILQVTPRVNSGGRVTLDIAQEVSAVNTAAPQTPGINSPTFSERMVTSRIVVQDGQTVGLAGLINDSVTRGNQGIPWLKDIPLLGFLAGTQSNTRTRTELLVLVTPSVVHSDAEARSLTEDMRDKLRDAALTPQELRASPPSGSNDPQRQLLKRLRLGN
jgi:general secretion pathway protein D